MKRGSSGGCGSFLFMLFLIFLILKVTGAVAWSWWWVASPFWMPAALVLAGLALTAAMGVGVFKVVKTTLRRQGFGSGAAARPASGADTLTGDVFEAEGSEVTTRSCVQEARGLPASAPAVEEERPVD